MSDETQNPETENLSPIDELEMLKERARLMGIPFSGKIGVDALKKKIQDRLDGKASAGDAEGGDDVEGEVKAEVKKTKAQIEQETRDRVWAESMALVRCRIYNLNPQKRDIHGEIITVANKYLGTVRKFIPFGEATDNGYHIPKVIYEDLKSRQFQQITTKQKNGKIEVGSRMVPEYNIEVLPPLTKEELDELAIKQAAAERFSND